MDSNVKVAIIGGVVTIICAVLALPYIQNFIIDQPPVISDLIPTPHEPQFDGTPITWMAKASDPNRDTIYYKFELSGPSTGMQYVVKQNWSEKSQWIWNSTDSDTGINYIQVSVKDKKYNVLSGNATIIKNYSIADRKLAQGEIGYSKIKNMILDETYTFSAYVARSDSINAARTRITTGNDVGERPIFVLNNSLIYPDFLTGSQVFVSNVTIIPPEIQVDLNGDAFKITRLTTDVIQIPVDRTGNNYGIWYWSVKPIEKGTHTLVLTPYEPNSKKPIRGGGPIRIEVTVKENVTTTTTTTKTETTPAGVNNTTEATKKTTPGFESVFALTGLLGVAYLALSRRE
jgi:hypothetical protein